MAEDINIKINVDSSDLGKAQKGIDDFGKKAEGATEHTGHLRKELRALGEAGKIGGEAMGQAGKEAGAIGEGARIAYAGLELMNGGLKNIAMTLATNPIFLFTAVTSTYPNGGFQFYPITLGSAILDYIIAAHKYLFSLD